MARIRIKRTRDTEMAGMKCIGFDIAFEPMVVQAMNAPKEKMTRKEMIAYLHDIWPLLPANEQEFDLWDREKWVISAKMKLLASSLGRQHPHHFNAITAEGLVFAATAVKLNGYPPELLCMDAWKRFTKFVIDGAIVVE